LVAMTVPQKETDRFS